MEIETQTHESFGLISIARCQSSTEQNLFGSSLPNRHSILLRISRAHINRNLSTNWVGENEGLIEVELSPAQFTEMITTLNSGPGTQCTIRKVMGKKMGDCPLIDNQKLIVDDFKNNMQKITEDCKSLVEKANELKDKATINKADRVEFVKIAETILNKVNSSLPYVFNQFNASMENVKNEVKKSVEQHISKVAQDAGIDHVRSHPIFPQIEFPNV